MKYRLTFPIEGISTFTEHTLTMFNGLLSEWGGNIEAADNCPTDLVLVFKTQEHLDHFITSYNQHVGKRHQISVIQ